MEYNVEAAAGEGGCGWGLEAGDWRLDYKTWHRGDRMMILAVARAAWNLNAAGNA